ncbi:MAG TPA: HAMP domain-containing sensor histidine kinase [Bacteroidota bacterium]|nr:HAMP domain-containing sensor histidine kinase [Bacteroidota bacterium]
MFSIKTKIIAAYTVSFGLLISAFAIVIYNSLADAEVAKLDARLESHADKLQTELEEDHAQPGFPNRSELDSIETYGLRGVRIRLLTLAGAVVFSDSEFTASPPIRWSSHGSGWVQRGMARWMHHKYRVLQWPVEVENRIQYILQVGASMHEIDEILDRLRLLFFIAIPGCLLLAGGAAYFITRYAFKPIAKMIGTAEQITAARLDTRLELPAAHDEVRQLGQALNEMIGRIDSTLRAQRQFVADASHELRTPLTILRSELEAVARTTRSKSATESLATSLSEVDRLSKMVGDLLMLAKLDASSVKLTMASMRLDELVLEGVQAVRGIAASKGVKVKIFIEEAIEITGDQEKLKSVVFNLLENAIKYSERKTTVSIDLRKEAAARTASIRISDHGIGIPRAEQARVFNRFYRGSQPRSTTDGSGLGLAIAQRFVELHGGSISLESEEGKGSTFTVSLPLP